MDPAGQQVTDTGAAGVIARPPLLFLTALLFGFVSDRLVPLPFPVPRIDLVYWIIAGSLVLIGLTLAAAGIRNFSRARTPVPTNEPTRVLVTTGIHAWTRNPIYLGMFLVYGGIGIAVCSPSILILTLPLAIAIRYGVVTPRGRTWNGALATPTASTKPACAAGGGPRTRALPGRAGLCIRRPM
jgi:protein-S-isoprenylcysteine O-methyltransferase Ste14